MFDLKKFTALAMAGTFAFGVAASTTYAAEAPHKELPKAEQPAPQPSKQQDKQAKQKNEAIQIEQMKDFEGQNPKDQKAKTNKQQPSAKAPAPEQKSKEIKETKHDQNHKQAPQEKKLPAQPEHK